MPKLALARLLAAPEEWNRRRLQIVLALVGLLAAAVVVGIVWSVTAMLSHGGSPAANGSAPDASTGGASDRTSSPGDLADARPGPLSISPTGTITIPQPTRLGSAQVPTGFPHTLRGALAQLIAIDQRAVGSASVVTAQDVVSAWARPGGPTPQTWSGVKAVTVLLSSAGLPANGSPDVHVTLRPAMAKVSTTPDGDEADPIVACVDFVATVRTGTSGRPGRSDAGAADRIAAADCQRMVWHRDRHGGRWMIAEGPEPRSPASVWPGTQASYDAGYKWLEVSP